MKLLGIHKLVVLGAVAALAACSSGSSGGGATTGGDGGSSSGGHDGGSSSGASSSGGDGGGGSSSGGDAGTPSIKITAPTSGATVTPTMADAGTADGGTKEEIPVTFTLTNFTLMAPGSCGTTPNCGHIHVLIDDANSCGGPPYNTAIVSGTSGNAIISACSTVNGSHKIILELHNDDHSAVTDSTGATISDSVQITVQGG